MNVNAEFDGIEQITERLEGLTDETKLQNALRQACALVERSAKQKAPKDTGELRRSITSEIEDNAGIVYTPLFYAPYIEFGTGLFAENGGRQDVPWYFQDDSGEWHKTSGIHPHPFLRPALEENREQITQLLRGTLFNG